MDECSVSIASPFFIPLANHLLSLFQSYPPPTTPLRITSLASLPKYFYPRYAIICLWLRSTANEPFWTWGMWIPYGLCLLLRWWWVVDVSRYIYLKFPVVSAIRAGTGSLISQFTDNSWSKRGTGGSRIWPLTLPMLKVRIVSGFLSTKICTDSLFIYSSLWPYEVTLPYSSIEERLWLIYDIKQVKLLTSWLLLDFMCGSGFIFG